MSEMITKITKEQYPDLWINITDDPYATSYEEHRRNSNFYTQWVFLIDKDNAPNNPELYGYWETDTFIRDAEYGMDGDEITELFRVAKTTEMVEVTKWVRL